MGDQFYLDQHDISGDVGALGRVGGGKAPSEVTGIDKSAPERILLLGDGAIDYTAWFNDAAAHVALSTLPRTDRIGTYCRGTAVGSAAASCVGKQINYDATRPQDGSLSFAVNMQANAWGLEWGELLTPGFEVDTAGANGASIDLGDTDTEFGWTAYLHVFSVTGTSVTVTLEDSADDSAFTGLTGGAFAAVTGAGVGAFRLTSSSATATVRRYVRAVSSGTFSNAVYAVNFVRYYAARGN
jgi:hypothetical protein